MSDQLTCAKCGSEKVIPRASLRDHMGMVLDTELQVEVAAAGVFRSPVRAQLLARVCGRCGYAELFVDEPAELYAAFRATAR